MSHCSWAARELQSSICRDDIAASITAYTDIAVTAGVLQEGFKTVGRVAIAGPVAKR